MLALMMTVALLIAVMIAFGAPFVPTLNSELGTLSEIIDVKGKTFVDIGSGDGRIVALAAHSGATLAVGLEINPLLWLLGKWRLRGIHNAQIKFKPWQLDELDFDVVYIFATKREMINVRLAKKIHNSSVITFGPKLKNRHGAEYGAFTKYPPVATEIING